MCGPIMLALITRTPERPRQPLMSHLGRISMYALLGALVAGFSATATTYLRNEILHTAWLLLPNLLLLLSALYLTGFRQAYVPVERMSKRVWRALEGTRNWASARGGAMGDYIRGALWGLLPCGMIYSALGLAVLAAKPLDGAWVMAAFGASTLPVLLALGMLSKTAIHRLQTPQLRRWLGIALLLLVAWNLYLLPDRLKGIRFSFLC